MIEAFPTKIACVIPACNEVSTIADVVARASRQCPWVIVVDDGSTDGTASQLKGAPVTVLRNSTNAGKAASLLRGARHAIEHGADAVVTLDGDGQHRPEDIPRLAAMAEQRPGCIVIAARVKDRHRAPRLRRFANRFADFWISWVAGYPIRDSQSGFRLYPARVFGYVPSGYDRDHGFVLESQVLIEAARCGCFSVCVEVETIYQSGARASHYRPAADTMRIVQMVAWKLICRGLDPLGLLRSLRLLAHPALDEAGDWRDPLGGNQRYGE